MNGRIQFPEFTNLVDDFYEYMCRDKKPRPDRAQLWYRVIGEFRKDDVEHAFVWMKAHLDSLPYNLPKAIKKAMWASGQQEEAEQKSNGHYGPCDDCNGTGILKLRIKGKVGGWHEPIAFCAACDNWRIWVNDPGDRVFRQNLVEAGIRHKPYNKTLSAYNTDPGSNQGMPGVEQLAHNSFPGESQR